MNQLKKKKINKNQKNSELKDEINKMKEINRNLNLNLNKYQYYQNIYHHF